MFGVHPLAIKERPSLQITISLLKMQLGQGEVSHQIFYFKEIFGWDHMHDPLCKTM